MNSRTKFVQSATGTGLPNANNSKRAQMLFVHTVAQGLANRNQIHLITLELSDLGHRIGSFITTQYLRK